MPKIRKIFAYTFTFYTWYFHTFIFSHFRIVSIRSPVFRRSPSVRTYVSGIVLTKLFMPFSSTFRYMQYIYTSARRFGGYRSKNINFQYEYANCVYHMTSVNRPMRLRVRILVRNLVVRRFADYKHPHKRVYGKKVGRFKRERVETCTNS